MSASNNRPDHSVSPELPSVPPKKPPCTNNGRSMSYALIILGIVTAAAFITVCFRHFRFDLSMHSVIGLLSLLSFYAIPIFSPLAILSLSLYQKRNAPFSDALLLISLWAAPSVACSCATLPPIITTEKSWGSAF